MADSPTHVIADDREKGSGVTKALAATEDVHLRVDRLTLGDYLVDERFRVERKTLPDLARSVVDGRLFRQASRLATASERAVLLLEGTARDLSASDMRREALQGALITCTVRLDLPLLRAKTPAETARLLCYTARQMRRDQQNPVPRSGRRPTGKRKTQLYVLQGLPNVGPARARRLLEQFGSVEAVMTASEAALQDVKGIGPKTARAIRWTVEEATAPYQPSLS